MTPDRHRLVGEIYHAALEVETERRAALLDEACAGDDALRRRVEALLAAHDRAGEFLETPALEAAAAILAEEPEREMVGRSLGPYDVLSLLGRGGMGDVYLARDGRLGRKVALKLLPDAFTRDADRLRRFEREARAASALSHPNIIAIFEIGEADGVHYIAAEYVDGQTLRQRLGAGPVELPEALDTAIQIAAALEAAHEAGIVHRDVKPENVMLRRDGYVKVLDFGLAKLIEKLPPGLARSVGSSGGVQTAPGVVRGTIAYMSPEQARGEEVDGRADVFGLGVVLYEMVAGRPPFEGATPIEVVAAILHCEPTPLRGRGRDVPRALERVVARALAKDRLERYETAADLLADLKHQRLELELAARAAARPAAPFESTMPTAALAPPAPASQPPAFRDTLEPVGGAMPLESSFYIERPTDDKFRAAIARQDSIVLVKGARQVGKTSLLARGLQRARDGGARVVMTDFQNLSLADLDSFASLMLSLATSFADQLDLDVSPAELWKADRSPGVNLELFLRREVLAKIPAHVVWGLDEVDRLFTCGFGTEVFGLFRSWHNKRALDPTGPWRRLTLAIAYATEAHLFVTDLNQSPFNVGTRLELDDFSLEQVEELNRRYDSPLAAPGDVARLYDLIGGHPYLVHRALYEMVDGGSSLAALEAHADHDEGPFGDHLRRLAVSLGQDAALADVVRGLIRGLPCPTSESFYRLRSAGLAVGDSARDAKLRCRLYASYLADHLG